MWVYAHTLYKIWLTDYVEYFIVKNQAIFIRTFKCTSDPVKPDVSTRAKIIVLKSENYIINI